MSSYQLPLGERLTFDPVLVSDIANAVTNEYRQQVFALEREIRTAELSRSTWVTPIEPDWCTVVRTQIANWKAPPIEEGKQGWLFFWVNHEIQKRREPKLLLARLRRAQRKKLERQKKRQGVLFPAVKPGRVYRPRPQQQSS